MGYPDTEHGSLSENCSLSESSKTRGWSWEKRSEHNSDSKQIDCYQNTVLKPQDYDGELLQSVPAQRPILWTKPFVFKVNNFKIAFEQNAD